jgi:hypothetical protein
VLGVPSLLWRFNKHTYITHAYHRQAGTGAAPQKPIARNFMRNLWLLVSSGPALPAGNFAIRSGGNAV